MKNIGLFWKGLLVIYLLQVFVVLEFNPILWITQVRETTAFMILFWVIVCGILHVIQECVTATNSEGKNHD